MFDIKENLKKLPDCPGVYIHKDKLGNVIYVGKAISLKNRVRQYFQSSKNMDAKVRAMVDQINEFEYIRCSSAMEALILEDNLIKKYKPKYNILLRDDKTYPYIKITAYEDWPRILKTRIVKKDGSKYFGPYSDVMAVNRMVEFLNNVYKIKKCSATRFPKGFRPCLNLHIAQCEGICINKADKEEYQKRIGLAMEYLNGKNKNIEKYLQEKMKQAAKDMNYEEAAKYRDYIFAAKALQEKQRVVLKQQANIDVVLATSKGHIVLFFIREGKLVGRETYILQTTAEDTSKEVVGAFLKQYYTNLAEGPSEIIIKEPLDDAKLIKELLQEKWQRKVKIFVPQKGERRALLQLCQKDVIELNKTIDEKEQNKRERVNSLGEEVYNILKEHFSDIAKKKEYRIEAYDISNTNGVETVGAMIVFEGLYPDKKAYRRFKVRTVEGSNDYGSMQEVLYRRLKRAKEGDSGFSIMPDLILVDGGKGHVSAAKEIFNAMNVNIPIAGMAKDDAHRTKALVFSKGEDFVEIPLAGKSLLFQYIGKIQEEVHRFAIEYHRNRRDKKSLTSILDNIEGIGAVKRNSLLAYFGGIEKIKEAEKEDLMKVKGITEKLAEEIVRYFH